MYERKVFLGFIRAHILHHAVHDGGIYGVEMMEELRRHGYEISPGTIYPILHEMERDGALVRENLVIDGKVRKIYRATKMGEEVLDRMKDFIKELFHEVIG